MTFPFLDKFSGLSNSLILVLFIFIFGVNDAYSEIIEEIYYLVNNDPITKLDFEEEMDLVKKNSEISFNYNNPISVMSNFIIDKLIEGKLNENNMSIKEMDISNYINVIVDKNNLGSMENFFNLLATSQNISQSEYLSIIKRKLSRQYYITRLISTPPINNREVEEYYQKNRETEFRVKNPIFNLSVLTLILSGNASFSKKLQIQNRMNRIKEEIHNRGLSFEEAVTKYSEDEFSKPSLGLLGWINPQQIGIGLDNIKKLSAMKKGDISDLMRDTRGISIYKLNDIIREGYIPYELAIKEAKNKVFQEKQQMAFDNSLKQLIEAAVLISKKPELTVTFNFP